MKTINGKASLLTCLLGLAITSIQTVPMHAASINGIFWSVPSSTAGDVPTLGNTPGPGATEWGTFTASALQFSGDSDYTLGGFLNSFGAASNIVYINGASAGSDLTNVLFEFTGTAEFINGDTFSVLHDDGVNMYVDGKLVVGAPGLTAPATDTYTYTGPSGVQSFDFIYANGAPSQADFQTTLNSAPTPGMPEPATLTLLPVGLAALWLVRRRVRP